MNFIRNGELHRIETGPTKLNQAEALLSAAINELYQFQRIVPHDSALADLIAEIEEFLG